MSNLTRAMMMGAAGAASDPLYVDDVFSTFLYEGDGTSSRSINNGIDLAGKGGLVWFKVRDSGDGHELVDTVRGATKSLESYDTSAEATNSNGLTAFTSTGFTVGNHNRYNQNTNDIVSWTFRKCPGFFDVVTYTGDGTNNRNIAHSLKSTPGFIMVKSRSHSSDWVCWHRSLGTDGIILNSSNAKSAYTAVVSYLSQSTSSNLIVGTNDLNESGRTYVAYIFAHDDQSFGEDGDESIIKCGGYTCNGSGVATIDLGFEPQWILVKKVTADGDNKNWVLVDTMRRWTAVDGCNGIYANTAAAEASFDFVLKLNSKGFEPFSSGLTQDPNDSYIYIAIRRPHKPPETAAKCFDVFTQAGSSSTQLRPGTAGSSVTDVALIKNRSTTLGRIAGARLNGKNTVITSSTNAQSTGVFGTSINAWDQMSGTELQNSNYTNANGDNFINYHFARKPGFFDVVNFGPVSSGGSQTLNHNLEVAPEMIWVKNRTSSYKWYVYHSVLGTSSWLHLNEDSQASTSNSPGFNNIGATSFDIGNYVEVNGTANVALLFATLPGISKVGSYTGDGTSSRTIDCGFTAGARFVMIKRTDSSAHWFVFDSVRGINAGSEPYLTFNETSADANGDFIDPNNVGFEISTNNTDFNGSGGTYIFLAIA